MILISLRSLFSVGKVNVPVHPFTHPKYSHKNFLQWTYKFLLLHSGKSEPFLSGCAVYVSPSHFRISCMIRSIFSLQSVFNMETYLGTFWKSYCLLSNSCLWFAVYSLTDLALPKLLILGFCTLSIFWVIV